MSCRADMKTQKT